MRPPARTLPIRLPPLPGEALDSWLEAIASRMDTTLGDVLQHLGLPVRESSGNQLRDIPTDWTISLDEHRTAAVAHAAGVDDRVITALTLARYDRRAVRLAGDGRTVIRHVLWGRGRGSRFCPDCLRSSGGRWQLSWRLGFVFACTRHQRLLADHCPECGRVPRQRPCSRRVVPRLELCGNPPIRPGGPISTGCGTDLTRTPTLLLPPEHPVLAAQERVMDIIDTGTAAFGPYMTAPQPASAALADIRALGIRFLADLSADVLRQWLPEDITEAHLSSAGPVVGVHLNAAREVQTYVPTRRGSCAGRRAGAARSARVRDRTASQGRPSGVAARWGVAPPWTARPVTRLAGYRPAPALWRSRSWPSSRVPDWGERPVLRHLSHHTPGGRPTVRDSWPRRGPRPPPPRSPPPWASCSDPESIGPVRLCEGCWKSSAKSSRRSRSPASTTGAGASAQSCSPFTWRPSLRHSAPVSTSATASRPRRPIGRR
ncbi:TniQ family protein [Streptomyces sp. MMS24-I2-30]|uniref:TniQ family protein n=1 Tax=Streptomyces sp. MMS24-I2-30 TaxID=3351564 RepID=UPI003896D229